jgi:hypothetical protein
MLSKIGDGSIFSHAHGFKLYYELMPKRMKGSPGLVIMKKPDPAGEKK